MTGVEAARRLLGSSTLRRIAALCPGETFLTGGSLRDRLLSLPTHDLDLVVVGDPRGAGRALAAGLGGTCFPLGKPPLVTWRIAAPGIQVDVWQPEDSIERDILRRDFTVNAVFWRLPRGPLLDLVGGLDDLEAGRIRVVSEANLHADPLRILRAFRLVATRPQLRLTADSETQLARVAPRLATVARERVVGELTLLLAGPAVGRALASAWRLGALAVVSPAWASIHDVRPLAELASRLSVQARSGGGNLRRAAAAVLPAVLAAPAAGFPERWDEHAAAASLSRTGWPPRAAARIARAAAVAHSFTVLGNLDTTEAQEVAAEAGADLPLALAWYLAADSSEPFAPRNDAARTLLGWARRAGRRPPLLSGDDVAAILDLPSSPARAHALGLLRREQLRGTLRGRRQAAAWLRAHWPTPVGTGREST